MFKTIAILGALSEEVSLIIGALTHVHSEDYAGVTYYMGKRGHQKLVVCCAGMGKANAAATTQVLITRYDAEAIIFSGIAGNMNSEIGIGDVVISRELCYHDAEESMLVQSAPGTALYTADPNLVDAAVQACRLTGVHHIVGRIATGDQFIGDAEVKKGIQATCNPDCVEMEGAAIAQIAMRNHIPFVVIRAMSDNSDISADELRGDAGSFEIGQYAETAAAISVAMIDALA